MRVSVEGDGSWIEVVGVVRDSTYSFGQEEPVPFVYLQPRSDELSRASVVMKIRGAEPVAFSILSRHMREVDASVSLRRPTSIEAGMDLAMLPARAISVAAGSLGLVALILAAIGNYGVVAYLTAQRTQEIAIRSALGATRWGLIRFVTKPSLIWTGLGLAIGLGVSVALTRILSGPIYREIASLMDSYAFTAAIVFLVAVAIVASYLPARRATRVDPIEALRQE